MELVSPMMAGQYFIDLDLLIELTPPSSSERAATSKGASCKEERPLSTVGSDESVV
jgi:hypothetical protein